MHTDSNVYSTHKIDPPDSGGGGIDNDDDDGDDKEHIFDTLLYSNQDQTAISTRFYLSSAQLPTISPSLSLYPYH